MPTFGANSQKVLSTCSLLLQEVANEAIKIFDFSVVCGTRGKEDQENACASGKSKVHYPNSKHNSNPSLAMDLCPYRDGALQWKDTKAFIHLAGIIKAVAFEKGIKVRWGGDFNRNNNFSDDSFVDMPHFELED